jgi:hypothetical protein
MIYAVADFLRSERDMMRPDHPWKDIPGINECFWSRQRKSFPSFDSCLSRAEYWDSSNIQSLLTICDEISRTADHRYLCTAPSTLCQLHQMSTIIHDHASRLSKLILDSFKYICEGIRIREIHFDWKIPNSGDGLRDAIATLYPFDLSIAPTERPTSRLALRTEATRDITVIAVQ